MVPIPPAADPNLIVHQIAPVIGVVGLALAIAFALRWLAASPVGEAIAEAIRHASKPRRIRRHTRHGEWVEEPLDDAASDERVRQLEEQVQAMQAQYDQLAERLDFTERVLAGRSKQPLGPGR